MGEDSVEVQEYDRTKSRTKCGRWQNRRICPVAE